MRILIVEDEPKMASYLRKGLMEASYTVDVAENGKDGLFLALHEEFDLVVLDVMLPEMDGFEVLKRLRAQKQTPVLLLTAREAIEDKVAGAELGADDYLLAVRVCRVPRAHPLAAAARAAQRARHPAGCRSRSRPDPPPRAARRHPHRPDRAGIRAAAVARRTRGEVLTRTFITSQIWDMNFDSDTNVVDAAIKRLRAKIDNAYEKKLIHTIRGMGYVLEDRS